MRYLNLLFEEMDLLDLPEAGQQKISFEGKNATNLLIVSLPLQEEDRLYLKKILNSVQLELDDVTIFITPGVCRFHELKRVIGFQKMLLFGITPKQLSLNIGIQNYQPFNFLNTQIVTCDSLSVIAGSENARNLLWKALKNLFKLP